MLSDLLTGVAAIVTSLGSFIAAIVAARSSRQAAGAAKVAAGAAGHAANEMTPNHGSSMRDSITRIEDMLTAFSEMQRSQGHQLGEIRRDGHAMHTVLADRLAEASRRIEKLENSGG